MSGIEGLAPEVLDAARGMGMNRSEILFRVELPLAAPAIVAGLRTAFIVNIGTATVGATIGAGGLGAPIISGLVTQNPSYLAEGALAVALLALIADGLFAVLEDSVRVGAAAPGPRT
jgi:osmoprotectant transport system permease protein